MANEQFSLRALNSVLDRLGHAPCVDPRCENLTKCLQVVNLLTE